jgi:hypothetical protein
MDDYPDTRLIVVDLLADIFGPTEEKKSGYFATYKSLSTLRQTAEDLAVPMLLPHHTNMRTDDQLADGFDRILGGHEIKGPVSECLLLDRERAPR